MLVSFRWTQAGRRGPRISNRIPVARTLLAGLTLMAASADRLATGPAASAASFDEPSAAGGTTSVLLHDPLDRESATVAMNGLHPAPTGADGLAEGEASPADQGAAHHADDASDCPGSPAGTLCTGDFCLTTSGCTAASGSLDACGCPACSGTQADDCEAGLMSGLGGRLGDWWHTRCCGTLADCDPPGVLQKLAAHHKKSGACWSGRADLLLLWRNAPPSQALITDNTAGITALDANNVNSALAAGPRFSLFRTDACGDAWEVTYLRAFNFRGQQTLPATAQGYDIAPPGIFGDQETQFNGASINLGSGIQSFELNRYHKVCNNIRFLGGFRWVEWRESATLNTFLPTGDSDTYQSNIYNSLYGGQIGFDANVLTTKWLRIESVMKGGAYGNNVAANSLLIKPNAGINQSYALAQSPASCAFVGELGFTGVIPITCCLDFRFGYFGLWLEGLAQPTRQFLTQDLTSTPPAGTLDTKGGTVVQGLSLGLEGRW